MSRLNQSDPEPDATGSGAEIHDRSQRLAHLLGLWKEAFNNGHRLNPAELCTSEPELLDDLAKGIAILEATDTTLETNLPFDLERQRLKDHHQIAGRLELQSTYGRIVFLAEGGLGEVYRAFDEGLHREVVLKFIQPERFDEESQSRFRFEAEVTSRLDHPGVVPVYGIGHSEGRGAFYAMRFIQGESMDAAIHRLHYETKGKLADKSLELHQLLSRFITVCQTIAYAHNRGIIHRDIKPQNIMLGRYGETLVVDWGLAMPVGRDRRFRESGERTLVPSGGSDHSSQKGSGTPAFMSPEQADGRMPLTPATDIFSLGATLYKVLVGRPPTDRRHTHPVGVAAPPAEAEKSGPKPSDVPKALEAICLKAMAHSPADRYATALELAQDIENYLAGEPVSAYSDPLVKRCTRWARKHRTAAQSILFAAVAFCVLMVAWIFWFRSLAINERQAREVAEVAKKQSLQMAAKVAARTIGSQLDLRWRLLEAEVRDQVLLDALQLRRKSPEDVLKADKIIHDWLNERFIQLKEEDGIRFESMFVLDSTGLQIARSPAERSVGKSYAFRDYFHGLGYDLTPEEAAKIKPITRPNLSSAYRSSSSKKLKVAFSVPIKEPQKDEILGVLGMSVDLGDLGVLQVDLGAGHFLALVDSRGDAIDGDRRRGLFLQHPELIQSDTVEKTVRLDDAMLQLLGNSAAGIALDDYIDPFLPNLRFSAAVEPVTIAGRPASTGNIGWRVLVTEKKKKGTLPPGR